MKLNKTVHCLNCFPTSMNDDSIFAVLENCINQQTISTECASFFFGTDGWNLLMHTLIFIIMKFMRIFRSRNAKI